MSRRTLHTGRPDTVRPQAMAGRHRSPRVWSRFVNGLRRVLCRLRGHAMATRVEPDRLFLQCLECGARTSGWALDLTPPLQPPANVQARVLPFAPRTAPAAGAPRQAA